MILGIGGAAQPTQEITEEEEELLWEKGILGSSTPQQLIKTLFYLIGVHFALRGGQEHHQLRAGADSQFSIRTDLDSGAQYLQYDPGTDIKGSKAEPPARVYKASNPARCVVELYKKYLSLCPSPRPPQFYLKELKNPTPRCWYAKVPKGRHTLVGVVKSLCDEAGLQGNYSNRSLRATAVARLYNQRNEGINYKRNEPTKRPINAVLSGDPFKRKRTCPPSDYCAQPPLDLSKNSTNKS